jgi:hypothetical protein
MHNQQGMHLCPLYAFYISRWHLSGTFHVVLSSAQMEVSQISPTKSSLHGVTCISLTSTALVWNFFRCDLSLPIYTQVHACVPWKILYFYLLYGPRTVVEQAYQSGKAVLVRLGLHETREPWVFVCFFCVTPCIRIFPATGRSPIQGGLRREIHSFRI